VRGDVLSVAHVGDCRCVIGSLPARDVALLWRQPEQHHLAHQPSHHVLPPVPQLAWAARQLTVDHDCSNTREADAVRARSRDPDAIRGGRVNGIISVTRSLGDGALKGARSASELQAKRASYMSGEPDLCSVRLQDGDVLVLIYSDGVHEQVSNATAVKVAGAAALQGLDPAEAVVRLAVQRACEAAGIDERQLHAMAASARRRVLDDVTCVCLLRKALLHRFENLRGTAANVPVDGGMRSAAEVALSDAHALKRQKQTL
jgi:serine/threonine protein phosphatase PrpC